MTKYRLIFLSAALLWGVLLCSCATVSSSDGLRNSAHPRKLSYNEKKFDAAFAKGDFMSCAGMLLGQKVSVSDSIRQNLDVAMLEHYAKAYDASDEICGKTDRLMQDAVTKSVSKTVVSATINENASDYTGTVYEYLYVNVFNALNYYNRGDMEGALVEIRKINNKQKEYISKYGEAALQKEVADQKEVTDADYAAQFFGINMPALKTKSPPAATEADVFRDSATARYLSLLFMKMNGDDGNARVDGDVLEKITPRSTQLTNWRFLRIKDGSASWRSATSSAGAVNRRCIFQGTLSAACSPQVRGSLETDPVRSLSFRRLPTGSSFRRSDLNSSILRLIRMTRQRRSRLCGS